MANLTPLLEGFVAGNSCQDVGEFVFVLVGVFLGEDFEVGQTLVYLIRDVLVRGDGDVLAVVAMRVVRDVVVVFFCQGLLGREALPQLPLVGVVLLWGDRFEVELVLGDELSSEGVGPFFFYFDLLPL